MVPLNELMIMYKERLVTYASTHLSYRLNSCLQIFKSKPLRWMFGLLGWSCSVFCLVKNQLVTTKLIDNGIWNTTTQMLKCTAFPSHLLQRATFCMILFQLTLKTHSKELTLSLWNLKERRVKMCWVILNQSSEARMVDLTLQVLWNA